MNKPNRKFDVIVIGGGAAGISAALWCDELQLSALLLEKDAQLGGQLLWTHNPIENHLGAKTRNGEAMRDLFLKQIQSRAFAQHLETEVTAVDLDGKKVSLRDGAEFSANFLIIATGVRRRKLGVEGEELFIGRGIIESGKKDQAAVKDKTALVVGGGDAALENALILAETAKYVYVAHRRPQFRARREFVERAQNARNVELLTEKIVRRLSGAEKIEAAELENLKTGEIQNLPIDVLLIRIGVEPNTEMLRGKLDLDREGYIVINNFGETSVKDVFAIGDVANPLAPTVSGAVGNGATAVKAILAMSKR